MEENNKPVLRRRRAIDPETIDALPREESARCPSEPDRVPEQAAQMRRQRERDRRQLILITAITVLLLVVAAVSSFIFWRLNRQTPNETQETAQTLPFSRMDPFSTADLTPAQLQEIRNAHSITVSDGPRGISVGDSLDKLLSVFPSDFIYTEEDSQNLTAYSTTSQILYCASYEPNQNGIMIALPPRGILEENNGYIVVTFLTPTSPYPQGTLDDYRSYEHLYCIFTVEPVGMTVQTIELGLTK